MGKEKLAIRKMVSLFDALNALDSSEAISSGLGAGADSAADANFKTPRKSSAATAADGTSDASRVETPVRDIYKKSMWLYLVDELEMKPVQDPTGIFPLEIKNPEALFQKTKSLLRATFKAMWLVHGVAGLLRCIAPTITTPPPPGLLESMEDFIEWGSRPQQSSFSASAFASTSSPSPRPSPSPSPRPSQAGARIAKTVSRKLSSISPADKTATGGESVPSGHLVGQSGLDGSGVRGPGGASTSGEGIERKAAVRHLEWIFSKRDKKRSFSGLRRVVTVEQTSCWTRLVLRLCEIVPGGYGGWIEIF